LLFNQSQVTKGSGVNGRLGAIFKAADGLRLGATIQTPTWFVIDDSYTEGLDNRGTIRGTTDKRTYDFTYNLRTPLKGSFGASYVIAGQALISADIDYVDYSSIRFSTNNDGSYGDNDIMIDSYKGAVNYRIGGEYKLDNLSLRAGYGINGSPYKNKDLDFDTKMYSGGLGYRVSNYYVDLTYQRVETNSEFSPYNLSNGKEPITEIKDTRNNVFLTLGLRF
jgi:long-subunit fatty acid transport protein